MGRPWLVAFGRWLLPRAPACRRHESTLGRCARRLAVASGAQWRTADAVTGYSRCPLSAYSANPHEELPICDKFSSRAPRIAGFSCGPSPIGSPRPAEMPLRRHSSRALPHEEPPIRAKRRSRAPRIAGFSCEPSRVGIPRPGETPPKRRSAQALPHEEPLIRGARGGVLARIGGFSCASACWMKRRCPGCRRFSVLYCHGSG